MRVRYRQPRSPKWPASCMPWAATRFPGRHHWHRHTGQDPHPVRYRGPRSAARTVGRAFPRHLRPCAGEYLCEPLEGIAVFDSSVAGLGGCPTPKAPAAMSPAKTCCTCSTAGHSHRHRPRRTDRRRPAHQPAAGARQRFAGRPRQTGRLAAPFLLNPIRRAPIQVAPGTTEQQVEVIHEQDLPQRRPRPGRGWFRTA